MFSQVSIDHNMVSNIKEMRRKPKLHVSVNLSAGVWQPSCTTPRRRRSRADELTSNSASHDSHEKVNSWVSFTSLYAYGGPLGGRRSSAIKSSNFRFSKYVPFVDVQYNVPWPQQRCCYESFSMRTVQFGNLQVVGISPVKVSSDKVHC